MVKMQGDGDCLFHALVAHQETGDGPQLRRDLADFLDEEATNQGAFAEEWLLEAENLRGPKEEYWGGTASIMAYSLMKCRTVNVHYRQPDGSCNIVVHRHTDVAPDETSSLEVLYNGHDHYDCLLEMHPCCDHPPSPSKNLEDFELAWEQPPESTTRYLMRKELGPMPAPCLDKAAFPSLQSAVASGASQRLQRGFCAPQNKEKKKKPNNKKKNKNGTHCLKKDQQPGEAAEEGQMQELAVQPPQMPQHRRYCKKTTPPPELRDDILTEICKAVVMPKSQHPHRKVEDGIQEPTPSTKSQAKQKRNFDVLIVKETNRR